MSIGTKVFDSGIGELRFKFRKLPKDAAIASASSQSVRRQRLARAVPVEKVWFHT